MKVVATVNVRGVDAAQMLAQARERFMDLANVSWTITEANVTSWGDENVSTRDELLPMWNGAITAEANIEEAGA